MTKKIIKEKKVVKKVVKAKVKLISYTLTAVIPHARYGNLQPSITVQAETIEDAKNFIYPHIEELMSKYQEDQFGKVKFIPGKVVTKKVEEKKVENKEQIPEKKFETTGTETLKNEKIDEKESKKIDENSENIILPDEIPVSESFHKAQITITGAMSLDAMIIIKDRLEKSVKLTQEEKDKLFIEFNNKFKELNDESK